MLSACRRYQVVAPACCSAGGRSQKVRARPSADLDRAASKPFNMADTQGLTKRLELSDLGGLGGLEQADPEALIQALRHPTADGFARWGGAIAAGAIPTAEAAGG